MSIAPCSSAAPVRGIVVFDETEFKSAYPMFATVSGAALLPRFYSAEILLNNSCRSLVCDANKRQFLLYLLTAHLAALFDGVNGQPPSGTVGRVADATEGSVRVGLDMGNVYNSQAWYLQTQWGATFWQLTAPYRTFVYVAPPPMCGDVIGGQPYYTYWPGTDCGC